MSGRYNDYKGSSRSTRDDSRPRERGERRRSRSRSPRRRYSPKRTNSDHPSPPRYSSDNRDKQRKHGEEKRDDGRSGSPASEEDVPAPPPPPRITKISMGFSKPKAPIKMSLSGPAKPSVSKPTIASVFADDDDEPEEMPAEAKMRMRNIGRETPTSAGPNSFGKTKQGFCDAKKVFEKNLKEALESNDKPDTPKMKFPQTIYKLG